jgi:signal transduction histidine kinase
VLSAAIYNEKKLLLQQRCSTESSAAPGARASEMPDDEPLSKLLSPLEPAAFSSGEHSLKFISPILASRSETTSESLYFDIPASQKQKSLLGFAAVSMDKSMLDLRIQKMISKSLFISCGFIIVAGLIAFFFAKMIRRPLLSLTEAVDAFGKDGTVQDLETGRDDEIGKLSQTFNHMAVSLLKRKEKLHELTVRVMREEESERSRLARELHDGLGQSLALIKINLSTLSRKLTPMRDEQKRALDKSISDVSHIIDEVRRLSKNLSPAVLEHMGLTEALRYYCEEFSQRYGIICTFSVDMIDDAVSTEQRINIYRFLQEALTNIAKHSGADRFSVSGKIYGGILQFSIADNGAGFDEAHIRAAAADKKTMGLITLEERAYIMRASFSIETGPGRGTELSLNIPIERAHYHFKAAEVQ